MNDQQIQTHLATLAGWQLNQTHTTIQRNFKFTNFHRTMTFVNAVADIAHAEDHHPDMEIGYNHCQVNYTTHSEGGLSDKDFICARQVDALFDKI